MMASISDSNSDLSQYDGNEKNTVNTKVVEESNRCNIQSDDALEKLKDQGYTEGLASSLAQNNSVFPLRIWVVDNSGSMIHADGHRFVRTTNKKEVKLVTCTRWDEIKDTVKYHAKLAAMLKAPTVFRLLNHPGAIVGCQEFSVAEHSDLVEDITNDIDNANSTMNKSYPGGATHLIPHILEIKNIIVEMAPKLRVEGKRVTIVLSTDGLPTNEYGCNDSSILQQFKESLRSLEGLPVWVVVRLCTDDIEVLNFYQNLDEELELSLEVLDDFTAEAAEVNGKNPWLNYASPLHRCREMGFYHRVFDLLDERALTRGELLDFFALLFGKDKLEGISAPDEDWNQFIKAIRKLVDSECKQWNPIKNKMTPWIDLKQLNTIYG